MSSLYLIGIRAGVSIRKVLRTSVSLLSCFRSEKSTFVRSARKSVVCWRDFDEKGFWDVEL